MTPFSAAAASSELDQTQRSCEVHKPYPTSSDFVVRRHCARRLLANLNPLDHIPEPKKPFLERVLQRLNKHFLGRRSRGLGRGEMAAAHFPPHPADSQARQHQQRHYLVANDQRFDRVSVPVLLLAAPVSE